MRHQAETQSLIRTRSLPPSVTEPGLLTTARVALLLLAAAGLYQGLWAQVAPHSFFQYFPAGMGWVATEGPYNEHLVRDVGGLVNGLAVVALVAAWSPVRPLLVATGVGWLVYAVPHLVFHVRHPLPDSPSQAANVAVLAAEVVLPLLGLLGATAPEGRHRWSR